MGLGFIDAHGSRAVGELYVNIQNYNRVDGTPGKKGWGLFADFQWWPPSKSLCCGTVGFYQVVGTNSTTTDGKINLHGGWRDDTRKLKRKDLLRDWVGPSRGLPDNFRLGIPTSVGKASLSDSPGIKWPVPIIKLVQVFESCAVCADKSSERYLEVFGCVRWGHVVTLVRGTRRWGTHKDYWARIATDSDTHVYRDDDDGETPNEAITMRGKGLPPSSTFLSVSNRQFGRAKDFHW